MLKLSEMATKEAADSRVPELARIATILQRRFLLDLFKQTSAKRLSIPQYTLLGFLAAKSGVPRGHLAKQMGHATSATTGLVDRLEVAGLVRRTSVKGDRRQKLVEITPKGRDLVGKMQGELRHHLGGILARLDSPDQDAWVRIYRTMEDYCREIPRA